MDITRKDFLKIISGAALTSALATRVYGETNGILKVSFRTALLNIDPAFAQMHNEYIATQAIYDNLTKLDTDLKPVPSLAESWTSSDNGATWTFKLRPGVKFHHGRELHAEDVVFSIKRILDESTGSPGRGAIGPISDVVADNPLTVKFMLEGPFAEFPTVMAGTFARITPRDASDNLNQRPIGTGPFKYDSRTQGQYLRLTRNDSYWMSGLPKVQEVWLVTYPAQAAEQTAFQTNEVQIVYDVPMALVPAMNAFPGAQVLEIASTAHQAIVMRCDRPPFNDVRVRQAVKHALNRENIIRAVLLGHGTVARDNPIHPTNSMYKEVSFPTFDVEAGKNLLNEAGYPNGLDIELFASNEAAFCIEVAQVIKPMLAAIGIRATIQQVPWDRFLSEIWKKKDFFINHWAGRTTTDEQLYPFYHSEGSWNEGFYANPEVDKLLEEARREVDFEVRKKKYQEAQEIISWDGPCAIPFYANYASAQRESVQGVPLSPLKWMDLREASIL